MPDRSPSAARREAAHAALAELEQLQAEGKLVKAADVQARADLAVMQSRERAGELIEAATASAKWASVAAMVKIRLGAVPSQIKQRVQRLTLEEVTVLDQLIREALESIASGSG